MNVVSLLDRSDLMKTVEADTIEKTINYLDFKTKEKSYLYYHC